MATKLSNAERLRILSDAQHYYSHYHNMSRQDRYDGVIALSEWDFFTVAQLSQLSGYSTATLYGWNVKRGQGSGRFNPMSLETFRQIVLKRVRGQHDLYQLVSMAVQEGNSQRVIEKMTGVAASTVSRMMKRINDNHDSRV
jgi:hypothetical protein